MEDPWTGSQNSPTARRRRSPATTAGSSTVDVAGLAVTYDAASDMAVADLLGRLPPSAAEADVRVRVVTEPVEVPHRPPDLMSGTTMMWRDAGLLTARAGLAAATASPADIVIDDDGTGGRRLLPFLLGFCLGHHQRFVLHVAVIDRDGLTALAVAPSQGGKSTLAAGAARGGWTVRGDDTAVLHVDPTTEEIRVTGLPRTAWVPAEVFDTDGDKGGVDQRSRLPTELTQPGASAAVDLVIAVTWSNATGTMVPAEASDQLPRLVGAFTGNHTPALARAWFPLAGRLARGPNVELALASDPKARLDDISRCLDQLDRDRPFSPRPR